MDLMAFVPDGWRAAGDPETADLLDAIAADEIHHVRFANQWVRRLAGQDKRNLFKVAHAVRFLDAAQKAFAPAVGATNLVGEFDRRRGPIGPDQRRRPAARRLHRRRDLRDPSCSTVWNRL